MKRRQFIAGLGSAAAWPVVAQAQQSAAAMIGFLLTGRRDAIGGASTLAAVHRGFAEMGYAEAEIWPSNTAGRKII